MHVLHYWKDLCMWCIHELYAHNVWMYLYKLYMYMCDNKRMNRSMLMLRMHERHNIDICIWKSIWNAYVTWAKVCDAYIDMRCICICIYEGKRMEKAYVSCHCMKDYKKDKCTWKLCGMSICMYSGIWIVLWCLCIWIHEMHVERFA